MDTDGIETWRACPGARLRRRAARAASCAVLLVATALTSIRPAEAAKSVPPGSLLTSARYSAMALPLVPLPAKTWKISYESTDVRGNPIVVTGSVLVPLTGKPKALVGFAVGSQGLADRCAPSAQLHNGTEYESLGISELLARGWAVAVTDYPGLGTPGGHPYVVGPALARSVLDSMRAARQLTGAGITVALPTAVLGYSEGGGAAGWVAQIAPEYAADLNVRAVAAGGVVADLNSLARSDDGGVFTFVDTYAFIGFNTEYPRLHLTRYLNAKGKSMYAKLSNSCLEEGPFDELPGTKAASLTTRDLFTLPALKHLMTHDSLGATAPTMPVLIEQSPWDEILPFAQAKALSATWKSAGADVTFRSVPAPDHLTGAFVAEPDLAGWLAHYLSAGTSR